MYTVQLSDGSHHELSANIIAENLYAKVNKQGHQQLIFQEIIGHWTNAEYENDMPVKTGSNFHLPKTTKVGRSR
jgi:membrane-bound lytic murein transglycosylase MltF